MMLKVGKRMKDQNRVCGFTLIEVLIVVAIMATLVGLGATLFSGTFRVQIKKESSHLISVVRFAYNEAITKGVPYRLVFDVTEQAYWLEAGSEGDQAPPSTTNGEEEEKTPSEEALPPPPPYSIDDDVVKKVKLGKEVFIRDVATSHDEKEVTEGLAYLYFFPTGLTEQAVIHLSNEEKSSNYSILVNPLTAKCRVENEYVELEKVE